MMESNLQKRELSAAEQHFKGREHSMLKVAKKVFNKEHFSGFHDYLNSITNETQKWSPMPSQINSDIDAVMAP